MPIDMTAYKMSSPKHYTDRISMLTKKKKALQLY